MTLHSQFVSRCIVSLCYCHSVEFDSDVVQSFICCVSIPLSLLHTHSHCLPESLPFSWSFSRSNPRLLPLLSHLLSLLPILPFVLTLPLPLPLLPPPPLLVSLPLPLSLSLSPSRCLSRYLPLSCFPSQQNVKFPLARRCASEPSRHCIFATLHALLSSNISDVSVPLRPGSK